MLTCKQAVLCLFHMGSHKWVVSGEKHSHKAPFETARRLIQRGQILLCSDALFMLIHYSVAREQVLGRTYQPNTLITALPFCFEAQVALLLWEIEKENICKARDLLKRRLTRTRRKGVFVTPPLKTVAWNQILDPTATTNIINILKRRKPTSSGTYAAQVISYSIIFSTRNFLILDTLLW